MPPPVFVQDGLQCVLQSAKDILDVAEIIQAVSKHEATTSNYLNY